MGKLVYSMHMSLDGYIEDPHGEIGFSAPADDVHAAANDQAREAAAFLFGRRLYETMEEHWTTAATRDDLPEVEAEFARIYVETPRYVFSEILNVVGDDIALVRSRDARPTVARLKEELDGPLQIGGAHLAGSMVDLVDEFVPVVMPVVVGGGKRYWPSGSRLDLQLVEERTFDSGAVQLRYARSG